MLEFVKIDAPADTSGVFSRNLYFAGEGIEVRYFTNIASAAQRQFEIGVESLHLDSSSFSVEGNYEMENSESMEEIGITYGHSKDYRPDLKPEFFPE